VSSLVTHPEQVSGSGRSRRHFLTGALANELGDVRPMHPGMRLVAVRHRERLLFRPGCEKCKALVSPEMIIAPASDMRAFGQLPKLSQ